MNAGQDDINLNTTSTFFDNGSDSLEKSMHHLKEMSQDINSRFLAATTKFARMPFFSKKKKFPTKDPLYSKEEL